MNNTKLPDVAGKYNRLAQLQRHFKSKFDLAPCIGAELEFYIHGSVDIAILAAKIGHQIKLEKGNNQYEVELAPSQNLQSMAKSINELRQKIVTCANEMGARADFSSKPFADDYGSSMHIHLNFPEDDDIEKYAKILCHYLPETLDYFLPKPEDYNRLDSKFMAPTHISFGGNNRTVLIRIPDATPRRLEHRLAAATADPMEVIYAILRHCNKIT